MDFIVIVAVLPFAILATLGTLLFIVTIFATVGGVGEKKQIMKHAEYDYYQMPNGNVRLDEG